MSELLTFIIIIKSEDFHNIENTINKYDSTILIDIDKKYVLKNTDKEYSALEISLFPLNYDGMSLKRIILNEFDYICLRFENLPYLFIKDADVFNDFVKTYIRQDEPIEDFLNAILSCQEKYDRLIKKIPEKRQYDNLTFDYICPDNFNTYELEFDSAKKELFNDEEETTIHNNVTGEILSLKPELEDLIEKIKIIALKKL